MTPARPTSRPGRRSAVPAPDARALDREYVWHPFTQMEEWCDPAFHPVVIVGGKGAVLRDAEGRKYLDGNSSIWTNVHGHRHPRIDAAIRSQLRRIAHSSFLGLTNDVAPLLAERLVRLLRAPEKGYRVFFSDDGSTAVEAALKMAVQARRQRGETARKRFVCLTGAYHGDTVGAMSLGHSPHFHRPFEHLKFEIETVPAPACPICHRRRAAAHPGARRRPTALGRCRCLRNLETVLDRSPETICGFFMEPLVQGAAGMRMQPPGYVAAVGRACRERGIWLVLDEVMTGFGRTGAMFACLKENVKPDLLALGKGLTGGYLPVAATLASREIHEAFLGDYSEFKTFFHGHSYTGNALGCAAALASLEIFERDRVWTRLPGLVRCLGQATRRFRQHPNVGDVRQEGLICAVELFDCRNSKRVPFAAAERVGARVCQAAQAHGLLTRPVGDVLVLMPPLCSTPEQIRRMCQALWAGLCDVLPFTQ